MLESEKKKRPITMRSWLANARTRVVAGRRPVSAFAVAFSLSIALLWARHEVFWAQSTHHLEPMFAGVKLSRLRPARHSNSDTS